MQIYFSLISTLLAVRSTEIPNMDIAARASKLDIARQLGDTGKPGSVEKTRFLLQKTIKCFQRKMKSSLRSCKMINV